MLYLYTTNQMLVEHKHNLIVLYRSTFTYTYPYVVLQVHIIFHRNGVNVSL